MRWTELGAFTPVMRTHDGLRKLENHHFDSDEETLAHFTLMAKIHGALTPHWLALAQESLETGLPMVRHTALEDPSWEPALEAHWQWMLGSDIVFAPVVTEGAEDVLVHLPEGDWEHLLSGESYTGRQSLTVDAPIGSPAVFVRKGALADSTAEIRALF